MHVTLSCCSGEKCYIPVKPGIHCATAAFGADSEAPGPRRGTGLAVWDASPPHAGRKPFVRNVQRRCEKTRTSRGPRGPRAPPPQQTQRRNGGSPASDITSTAGHGDEEGKAAKSRWATQEPRFEKRRPCSVRAGFRDALRVPVPCVLECDT